MIVIGDVHGQYKTLMALVAQLPHNNLCFVGDLVDRGPDSKKVVDYVLNNNHKCVLGNHEYMMMQEAYIPYFHNMWTQHGGKQTIASFDNNYKYAVDWFYTLPIYIEYKNFVITHSTAFRYWDIRESEPDRFRDMVLWNKDFHGPNYMEPLVNVFGHTPVNIPIYNEEYIMIDGGCGMIGENRKLFAVDLDTLKFYGQERLG